MANLIGGIHSMIDNEFRSSEFNHKSFEARVKLLHRTITTVLYFASTCVT